MFLELVWVGIKNIEIKIVRNVININILLNMFFIKIPLFLEGNYGYIINNFFDFVNQGNQKI